MINGESLKVYSHLGVRFVYASRAKRIRNVPEVASGLLGTGASAPFVVGMCTTPAVSGRTEKSGVLCCTVRLQHVKRVPRQKSGDVNELGRGPSHTVSFVFCMLRAFAHDLFTQEHVRS
jgi:hypothetical protein